VASYSEALRLQPDFVEAHRGLALALARQGKLSEGLPHLARAISLRPTDADLHCQLATIHEAMKKPEEAMAEYREALRLNAEYAPALNNLAWLLATHPIASIRNGKEAVDYAERACKLTGYHQALFVGTLAASYAEAGRLAEAASTAQKAIDLATAAGQKDLAATNQKLMALYGAGKTFRDLPAP
jgi:Flp pilus assembly protein TadD